MPFSCIIELLLCHQIFYTCHQSIDITIHIYIHIMHQMIYVKKLQKNLIQHMYTYGLTIQVTKFFVLYIL